MKLASKVKLKPSPEQADALKRTMEVANSCCDWLSEQAWNSKTFCQFALHKLAYAEARNRFPLSSQMVVRAIAKVADSYRLDKLRKRKFRKHGAISYDLRILRFMAGCSVSIWSVDGRLKFGYAAGERQHELLKAQQGEAILSYQRGKFYLSATCVITHPEISAIKDFLGVDFGIVEIASTSDGKSYSGSQLKSVRHRQRRLRTKLQKKATKAAKRRLKNLAGKEQRFATHTNHCISKQIVSDAKGTGRGIAIEELGGIRDRVTVGRKQRAILNSWAFSQLRIFMTYKAKLAGVPLVAVDPRNTSRECVECGNIDKRNRPNQSTFRCTACGYTANADINAALNIRSRATSKLAEGSNARPSDCVFTLHS